MQTLNVLRWSCTFYQNVYRTVVLNEFTKRTCQMILPTSDSVVLTAASTFNRKCVMGIRGLSTIASKPVECFKANKTISHPNPSRTLNTVSEYKSCWKCGSAVQLDTVFFCPACKVIQAPDEHATHFDIMDCDKSFALDIQKLQQRYLYLQRSLHPDNFSQKTQKEQEYSEIQSALVNKAYRTLLKPLSRGLYLLELGGMGLEEGTGIGPDSEFLLEIMDINESLAEAQVKEDANNIGISIQGRLQDLTEKINSSFQKGDTQSAKMLIIQMKYFAHIQEKVKEKLSEMLV